MTPEMEQAPGLAGDVWTWTAMDAESKLMVFWLVGARDAGYAQAFMEDVASDGAPRTANDGRPQALPRGS